MEKRYYFYKNIRVKFGATYIIIFIWILKIKTQRAIWKTTHDCLKKKMEEKYINGIYN